MMRATPSPWERLIAIATLGTRRAPLPAETLWPDSSLASPGPGTSSELTVLRAAAATWLWDVAGRRAVARNEKSFSTAVGHPLPEEEGRENASGFPGLAGRVVVKETAAWRLGRMINGEYRELIPEWFTLAQRAGKSLPPHWLPVVLDGIAPQIRNAYPDVLGPAAPWLAARNPNWTVLPMTPQPSEQRWHEGTLEKRRAELAAMRMRDASGARRWVESTWPTDPADARERFLEIMKIGLSAEDEPFLEAALDDRRKGVRLQAADCLARLPDSQLVRRHLARLEPLLVLEEQKSGLLAKFRKRKLQIELPAALDKAAIRDGIEPKPPAQRKVGERAFWLTQMIAMVPPRRWCDRFDCDAGAFVAAVMATDYAGDLLSALSAATVRYPHPEWISALARGWIESKNETLTIAQQIASLAGAAPPDERMALLESLLSDIGLDANVTFYLLSSVELPWNSSITWLALRNLEARVRADSQQWSHPRNALDEWARRCDVETAAGELPCIAAICDEKSPWRNALDQMNAIVDFRAAMRMELLT